MKDDGHSDNGLCRRHRQNEKNDDLGFGFAGGPGQGQKGEIPGVEHDLDRHELSQEVPLDEKGQDAEHEKEDGQGEEKRTRGSRGLPFPGQGQGPDERGDEKQGRELERIEIIGEQEMPETGGVRPLRPERPRPRRKKALRATMRSSAKRTAPRTAASPERPFFSRAAGPLEVDGHDGEEEEDHDRAGVDDDLDDGDEGSVEEAEDPAERGEGEDQEKGVMAWFREMIMATTEPMQRKLRKPKIIQAMTVAPLY